MADGASNTTKLILYGLAAGYCQYRGCAKRLLGDELTGHVFNTGYGAHVVAATEGGPRGDKKLSPLLKDDVGNLMLLCDVHHRLVDKGDREGHPTELLLEMKREHEARVEAACGIPPSNQSHVLIYGANIGSHESNIDTASMGPALLQRQRYPIEPSLFIETKDSHRRDESEGYWQEERANLIEKFNMRVRPLLANAKNPRVSVFALAPQPLLVLLGSLLTDKKSVDVYQRHREPEASWAWPDVKGDEGLSLNLERPTSFDEPPALVLSLSATIEEKRIATAMPDGYSLWRVSASSPSTHCIRSPEDLGDWRKLIARVLDEVKACHGEGTLLHVFPVVPNSAAVSLGLVRQEKADLPLRLYDQIPGKGFIPTFTIE